MSGIQKVGHALKQGNNVRKQGNGFVLFSSSTSTLAKTFTSQEALEAYAASNGIRLVVPETSHD